MSENLPRVYSEAVKAFNDSDVKPRSEWVPLSERVPWHFRDSYVRPNAWPQFRLFRWRYGRRKR